MKKIRSHRSIMLSLVVFGAVVSAVLTYLGTGNGWLVALAGLAGFMVMRIWWICERKSITERSMVEIHTDARQLSDAVSILSLEVADLNIHSHSLSPLN